MIISPVNRRRARGRKGGFTIVELIIAASISSILLVGILTTFLMIVRSGIRLSSYSTMESQTRRAFEQMGVDLRMANNFTAQFTGSTLTSFTLSIPPQDLSDPSYVTYGFYGSAGNYTFYAIPGKNPATGPGGTNQLDLITGITDFTVLRYDGTLNADGSYHQITDTTGSPGIKHVQISVSVSRSGVGVAEATQVIRSSAFTMRNI